MWVFIGTRQLMCRGCDLPNPSFSVMSHSEIPSFHRVKMDLTRRNPPAHHWYPVACRILAYFYSAGDPGLFRRPWRALEAVTYLV
ncbi:hypothetical protein TNCV_614791 [Trichonephila clavipes]|nr:hypothetical protein TNCV_614791 [Trichonephila clavipes]